MEWKNKYGDPLKNLDSWEPVKTTSTSYVSTSMPVPDTDISGEVLHLAGRKVSVTGEISGDGFIVCKGSGFYPEETKSC